MTAQKMQERIELLYCERNRFGGYMLVLILFWHEWMILEMKKDRYFWIEKLSHNSVIFIDRGILLIQKQKIKEARELRRAELRARWSK